MAFNMATANQYANGGVWKQVSDADASGPGTTYDQYAAGGIWNQLRLITGTPVFDQYTPGGCISQAAAGAA